MFHQESSLDQHHIAHETDIKQFIYINPLKEVVADIRYSLPAQTFGCRDVDFLCHVLYTHSPHQSPHGQGSRLQFVLEAFNTFAPSRAIAYTNITHM